jgi:hypothetical protein
LDQALPLPDHWKELHMLHNVVTEAWNASAGDVIGAIGLVTLLFIIWRIIVALTVRDAERK